MSLISLIPLISHTIRAMKLHRLRGRKVCDFVQRKGRVYKSTNFTVRVLLGAPKSQKNTEGVFLGTFASTKLHKSAVKRNRMRRRCREALRIAIQETDKLPTVQLLLSPRSSSLTCDYADIQEDVASFLSTLRS